MKSGYGYLPEPVCARAGTWAQEHCQRQELEPAWWEEVKVKILRYREVGEKAEKLSHQFLLASWHSCSTSENVEVFSAVYF